MPLHGGVSLSAQTLDNGACPGDLLFVKRRTWRIAAVSHCFDRLLIWLSGPRLDAALRFWHLATFRRDASIRSIFVAHSASVESAPM